jgi:hypothetical protein
MTAGAEIGNPPQEELLGDDFYDTMSEASLILNWCLYSRQY